MGRAGCPSLEQHCLILVGTGEDISARIHVANSQGDRAKEGRRREHRHSANFLLERVESFVTFVASIVVAGIRMSGVPRGSTDVSKRAKLHMSDATACKPVSVTRPNLWPTLKHSAQEWENRSPVGLKTSIVIILVLPGSRSNINESTEYTYFSLLYIS